MIADPFLLAFTCTLNAYIPRVPLSLHFYSYKRWTRGGSLVGSSPQEEESSVPGTGDGKRRRKRWIQRWNFTHICILAAAYSLIVLSYT